VNKAVAPSKRSAEDAPLHDNSYHGRTRPRQNHDAVARHTVNSTPWANGNSPEKLTVFVARRM